ncbi:hypothetical protein ES706_04498 [subsurface metagenome]
MKKIHLGIIAAVIVIVIVIVIAASVFRYYTAQTAMSQAKDLFDSSDEKYAQAMEYWDENDYAGARIKLAGAKTDVEEGKKYLEKADIEPARKQFALYWCDAWSNLINCVIRLSDAFEDYDQAMLRWGYGDWDGVVTKFLDAMEDINQAQPYFLSAKEDFDLIDVEVLPSELKSYVTESQAYFSEYEALLPDFSGTIDAFIPFVRGLSHLPEGASYLEREDWHAAKIAFGDSLSKIREAKGKFDTLRYCETTYYASLAAELYSATNTMEEGLAHYITGCEYAEAGYYSSATTEFETGYTILEEVPWA